MDWTTPDGIKRNNVDFLRLFLAVMVIYSHSFLISHGPDAPDGFDRITRGQIDGGYLAVNCFFAISGFLIARSWVSAPGFGRYLLRRARRIVPGYLAAMLVCAIAVAPIAARPWHAVFSRHWLMHVLVNTLLLKAYPGAAWLFPANPTPAIVNGPMWTIEFEFGCYLLLGAAGVLGVLRSRWVCLLVFGATMAWYGLQQFKAYDAIRWGSVQRGFDALDHLFGGNSYQWPRLAASFWSGACFYCWRTRLPRSKALAAGAVGALVLGIVVGKGALVLPIAGTYLLLYVAYAPILRLENFGRRGDFSYGTYLYAYPIQQLIILAWPGLGAGAMFALSAPLAVAAGALSWYGIEQHFGLRRRRALREGFTKPAPATDGVVVLPVSEPA
jgi:peptidoglycan/LPS O-acetylase OafA/YrhL